MPFLLALSLAALALTALGCEGDALYTYCTGADQCGSRIYNSGEDDEYELFLVCIEATVEVEPGRDTVGAFCTIDCVADRECDSRAGLPDGACIEWEGDAIGYCYQRCASSEDCYPSSTCEDVERRGEPLRVCLPGRV